MARWRARILGDLVPGVVPLTLAADPDRLLLDEELLEGIRGKRFELLTFEDPVAFRLAHEVRFRHRRASGHDVELLLRFDNDDLAAVPYDLLRAGRPLRFGLSELFPDLSYAVLAALDTTHLNALDHALRGRKPQVLGESGTKDFVLQYVFGIRPAEIRAPADLLHVLLRRHYRGVRMSRLLDERLVDELRRNEAFASWPLEAIVSDPEAFIAFLQERWPVFLAGRTAGAEVRDRQANSAHGLSMGGPAHLPFDDADVRVYIDTLFLEGRLAPVPHPAEPDRHGGWVNVGISSDPEADRLRRIEKLIGHVGGTIPEAEARHADWLAFAWLWAELGVLWSATLAPARQELRGHLTDLRIQVDRGFLAWVERRYAGLHNQPPDPPVMVHHLPRYLARRLEQTPKQKVALIVVDGLALDQWLVLRRVLENQCPALGFRSGAVFAWTPTITSVSRQAMFAGRPPFYFESSILTTEKEPSLWHRFWAENGLDQQEVGYLKDRGDGSLDELRESTSLPGLQVLGLVVHKVDDIMHGMELGASGMHNQIRQWAEEGPPAAILEALLEAGFVVFLTSDHGNIEATGYGRPSEGALVSTQGKRARLYSDTALRDRVLDQFPDAIAWPGPGLPADCHALLAPARSAFARDGDRIVGHGGASLEELIVPLIEVRRTEK